jgi:hypothetical protein
VLKFGTNFAIEDYSNGLLFNTKIHIMKTQLSSSTEKVTKGISQVVAFVLAITLALSLGCIALLIS